MALKVRDALELLPNDALRRLCALRDLSYGRSCRERLSTLARSYQGDFEQLIEDLRREDLLKVLSGVWEDSDGRSFNYTCLNRVSLWMQILWAAAEKPMAPEPPDRRVIEPSGDILALARQYLPAVQQPLFLKRLDARRREVAKAWGQVPELRVCAPEGTPLLPASMH